MDGHGARQGGAGVRPDERAAGSARARGTLRAHRCAEYFRDEEGKDVLLFIDNIFRFTQAGSEVSALLGRIPSAVGYQPTLSTDMGELQERITSTNKGSITSVQAIYVPADDLTDPAPATAFTHLDATTVLSRDLGAGHLPAVDPLDSTSRILDPQVVGEEHYRVARGSAGAAEVQGSAGHHRDSRHGRALGRRQDHGGPGAEAAALLRSPSTWRSSSPVRPASTCRLEDTIRGFKEILEGKHDDLPEQAFYASSEIEFQLNAARVRLDVAGR